MSIKHQQIRWQGGIVQPLPLQPKRLASMITRWHNKVILTRYWNATIDPSLALLSEQYLRVFCCTLVLICVIAWKILALAATFLALSASNILKILVLIIAQSLPTSLALSASNNYIALIFFASCSQIPIIFLSPCRLYWVKHPQFSGRQNVDTNVGQAGDGSMTLWSWMGSPTPLPSIHTLYPYPPDLEFQFPNIVPVPTQFGTLSSNFHSFCIWLSLVIIESLTLLTA